MIDVYKIAQIAHEVNRALCVSFGDNSQPEWKDAPEWQVRSAVDGVNFHLNRTDEVSPEESHQNWYNHKLQDGWTYGPVKDVQTKTHPCMVPYADLSPQDKAKDLLFSAVVRAATTNQFVNPFVER